ncbi:MAG: hypothetical protein ABSA53_36870 [Streptosporangiaceae bacterium]|jgi:hypothetical protein
MTASDDREITPPDMPPRAESATLGLKPISLDLEPAVQQFVTELRRVFSKLEISLGEYSRRNYRDKSVLSRYLSGNRIPSRELLDELIDEISRTRSIPLSAEAENRLHKFHLEALASRDRRAYQIQVLTDLLENATTELWQANTAAALG